MRPPALAAALALALALAACAKEPPRCPGCNLILISVDTLRGDRLPCLGYERETLPAVCDFFADAWIWRRATSQSAWTAPAHASMFTGRYPWRHGVNMGPTPPTLGVDQTTIFGLLRERGYWTAALHGGGYVTPVLPADQLDFALDGVTYRQGVVGRFDAALADKPEGAPFFVFLHGFDPHVSYKPNGGNHFLPPDAEFDRKADASLYCRYLNLPDGSKRLDPALVPEDPRERAYIESLYDSEVLEVDRSLGELFAHLAERGLLENTVVVFTSDHGDEFFEHGSCEHVKTVYDELLHVPLLLRVPGARRREFRAPVPASISLPATLLDVLGIEPPPGTDFDAGSLLAGDTPEIFFAETAFRYDGGELRRTAAIRRERKLILDHASGRLELYDLAADPGEQRDLVAEGVAPDPALRKALEDYAETSARAPRDPASPLDPRTQEQLRSLGYIE